MATKTEQAIPTVGAAIAEQANLLEQVIEVVLKLIKKDKSDNSDRAIAQAEIEDLVAADKNSALAMTVNSSKLQDLLDAATAAVIPSTSPLANPASSGDETGMI